MKWVTVCAWGLFGIAGCGGDARMELSAADTLLAVASEMERVVEEYHGDVSRHDTFREDAMVSALVARLRKDAEDDVAVEVHTEQFREAMQRVRADRETAWARRTAALENVEVLRELSSGLQRMAIESLTLQDEMRRYLTAWIDTRQRAQVAAE